MNIPKKYQERVYDVTHDEGMDFIKWLAKRDGLTVKNEMRCLFNLQLREEMELYNEERLLEEGGNE